MTTAQESAALIAKLRSEARTLKRIEPPTDPMLVGMLRGIHGIADTMLEAATALAVAHAAGTFREGVEAAAKWHDAKVAKAKAEARECRQRDDGMEDWMNMDAAFHRDHASAIRGLHPPTASTGGSDAG